MFCFMNITEASSPMSTRNFPPSFWDSNYIPPAPAHPQVYYASLSSFSMANLIYTTYIIFV